MEQGFLLGYCLNLSSFEGPPFLHDCLLLQKMENRKRERERASLQTSLYITTSIFILLSALIANINTPSSNTELIGVHPGLQWQILPPPFCR